MTFDQAGDRGDQLRQACAQGHHGQPDYTVRYAQRLGDQGAVVHQQAGADGDGRRADHQQQDFLPQRFFFTGFREILPAGVIRCVGVLFHIQD